MADPFRDSIKNIEDEAIKARATFKTIVEQATELAKTYAVYRESVRDVKEISTSMKHITDSILGVTKKLGEEKVREKEMAIITHRLEQEKTKLDQVQSDLRGKATILAAEEARLRREIAAATTAANTSLVNTLNTDLTSLSTELTTVTQLLTDADLHYQAQKKSIEDINAKLEESNKLADRYQRKVSVLEKLFSNIARIPIIGPMLNAQDIADKFQKGTKAGFGEIGMQLKNILKSGPALAAMGFALTAALISGLKSVIKQVMQYNEAITSISNNTGMAVQATIGLVSSFNSANEAANTLPGILDISFISLTNISKAMQSLQTSFETSAIFSNKMVQAQILLTEQMGLTNEEAASIQKYNYLAGVDAKTFLNTVTKQVSAENQKNTIALSYRKVIEGVAKTSAEITTSYKNNPKYLIDAVIQAQKLGLTLEDTRKISESLLNFESSIENELKAELLLGKSLNFEKARSLALDGKSAEAAAELLSQTGGLVGLTKLNVIQRRALAESIGMSAEELTKAAQQEEILKAVGKGNREALIEQITLLREQKRIKEADALVAEIAKQKGGEILAQDIAKASLNKQFEQTMIKIKEVFVEIGAGPITKMLTSLADLVKNAGFFKTIIKGTVAVATGLAAALMAVAVAMALATGGLSVAAAAGIAIGAGVLAGGGMTYALSGGSESEEAVPDNTTLNPAKKVQDSAISPKGNIMISTPEGQMIKVGERDYVYTTPVPPSEMLGRGAPTSTRASMSSDTGNDEMVSLLRQMVSVLKLKNNVYMDGIKVGEVLGMSSNSFA